MVVQPPLADLRHPVDRWQTVFAATPPLARKSMRTLRGATFRQQFRANRHVSTDRAASFPQHLAMGLSNRPAATSVGERSNRGCYQVNPDPADRHLLPALLFNVR